MQAVAGQRKQKVAAAGFQSLLFRIIGQKPKHQAAYAQVAGVPRRNDAEPAAAGILQSRQALRR